MKLSDEHVVDRIRSTLSEWADELAVGDPPGIGDRAPAPRVLPHSRRSVVWLVAAVAAVTVALLAALVLNRPDEPSNLVHVGPVPSSTTEIPVGRAWGVRGLAVTDDAAWVTSQFDAELYRIDPSRNDVVATFAIPDHVEGVLAVGGWLWLSRYAPDELVRIDPASGAVTGRVAFDSQPNPVTDGNRLWVVAARGGGTQAVEIDPATAQVVREIDVDTPPGFATIDGDDLWFASFGTTDVVQVDLTAGRVVQTVDVLNEPRDVVVAGGSVWVATNKPGIGVPGSVVRVDPVAGKVTAAVTTGRFIHSLASSGESVWATNFDDGTLSVIGAASAELIATTPIGDRPGGVASGHGSIWVTPHRRATLVRIDPSQPLEAAAVPDIARAVDVSSGSVFVRCSGSGSPTVVLEAGQSEGAGAWAVVEARLSQTRRVCSYDRVGIADSAEEGQAGPAATIAADLATALAEIGEHGPYVVVGEMIGALYAQMFAASHPDDVVGLLLVDPISADYFDRVRPLLSPAAKATMDDDMRNQAELRELAESSSQVASIEGFGELPIVVLGSSIPDRTSPTDDEPLLTAAESEAVGALIEATRLEQAALSTNGRLVTADGQVAPQDVVAAVEALLSGP